MVEHSNNHSKGGGSTPPSPLQSAIEEARERFKDNPVALEAVDRYAEKPDKCFQRHIREVRGEQEPHAPMASFDGAIVEIVDNKVAAAFIKKYEWLGSMGAGTMYAVAGIIEGEIFGIECFGRAGKGPGEICRGQTGEETKFFADRTFYLMRGACAPWAHKKAASWLIRKSCSLLHQQKDARVFFAYSDAAAGEVGIVYQRSHWKYLGTGLGKGKTAGHTDYVKSGHPESPLTSYKINHGRIALAGKMGAPTRKGEFRPWLVSNGWSEIERKSHDKGKYVWFEGTPEEIAHMRDRCLARFGLDKFVPYPERKVKGA